MSDVEEAATRILTSLGRVLELLRRPTVLDVVFTYRLLVPREASVVDVLSHLDSSEDRDLLVDRFLSSEKLHCSGAPHPAELAGGAFV